METIYSLSGDVPTDDVAQEGGDEVALWPGALTSGSVKRACSIRKLSAGGAILHCDHEVEIGERLELELMNGEHLAGRVAWRRGGEVGLAFDTQIDVFAIIAQDIVSQPGERRRMPRVELVCSALLDVDGASHFVTTRDVSQGGAKLDVPFPLHPEQKVTVTLDGLRPVDGVVRWSAGRSAGIAFLPELKWQELMLWLKERRKASFDRAAAPYAPAPAETAAPAPEETSGDGIALNLPARVREGTRRWQIDVASITTRSVAFDSFAALGIGSLLWIVLPGLEGWPARIVSVDGYRFTCEFTQPLHPAVLERVLALAKDGAR
ncbi:MAG: PilZ domain-containing protein [Sphingomonadaceae bacterium]|nr:PilZ domain-containing protein [Sphingomonadaceae bacterium]